MVLDDPLPFLDLLLLRYSVRFDPELLRALLARPLLPPLLPLLLPVYTLLPPRLLTRAELGLGSSSVVCNDAPDDG